MRSPPSLSPDPSRAEDESSAAPPASVPLWVTLAEAKHREKRRRRRLWIGALAALATVAIAGTLFLLLRPPPGSRVTAVEWTHSVIVERYPWVANEGFTPPAQAAEVTRDGERVFRVDKVPDGTRTETYTEDERCGEDCTRTSKRCDTVNGVKRCTGGDRRCTTRYCSRTKTRQVPQFKDVPVMRPFFKWKEWGWKQQRVVTRAETSGAPSWPTDEEIALDRDVGPGEKERASREARYRVIFRTPEGKYVDYEPKTLEEFATLGVGTERALRIDDAGEVEVLE
jgi:hypothetical protein